MGRRDSKINFSGIKISQFFVPELMAAAVLVKTMVFELFLMIFVFFFFAMFGVTRWDN